MHLIKDENGNLISHGHAHEHTHTHSYEHTHEHTHEHGHEDEHDHTHEEHSHDGHVHHTHDAESSGCKGHCDSCGSECEHDHKKESLALLTYMLQHNEHHAAELDQMADNLVKLGLDEAAKQIKESVGDFQKGNMRLSLALTLMKEQMKED